MRLLLTATALCALSSCASMSKSECVYADWKAIGFEDGSVGAPASAISSRRQACAAAGVTPSMEDYLAGRESGLEEYCTPANGFASGENGEQYSGVCGKHHEASFLEQYRAGARLYTLRDRVQSADNALRHANEDLGDVKFQITSTAAAILKPELSVIDRATMVARLKDLSEDSERIERSIPALRTNLDIAH